MSVAQSIGAVGSYAAGPEFEPRLRHASSPAFFFFFWSFASAEFSLSFFLSFFFLLFSIPFLSFFQHRTAVVVTMSHIYPETTLLLSLRAYMYSKFKTATLTT